MRVVAAARGWIGTPYVHQASCKGAGADCLGLVRGVWREVVGDEPEGPPPYTRDWAEVAGEEMLWAAARRRLVPVSPDRPFLAGEVLLFRMRSGSVAKHLAILSEDRPTPRIVHAYSGRGVVECDLSAPWVRRVVARFDFPLEG